MKQAAGTAGGRVMNAETKGKTTMSTYRDHGAAGPLADLAVWDDATDHARITKALYACDWPTKVTTTLAGFITAASLQASAHAVNDGPSADTAAGVAQTLSDLETELTRRA
jgi:hypothetical protein